MSLASICDKYLILELFLKACRLLRKSRDQSNQQGTARDASLITLTTEDHMAGTNETVSHMGRTP